MKVAGRPQPPGGGADTPAMLRTGGMGGLLGAALGVLGAACVDGSLPSPSDGAGGAGDGGGGGAALLAPPPGLAAPTNLFRVVVANVAGFEARLVGADGRAIATHAGALDATVCPAEVSCGVLELDEALLPETRYLVEVAGARLGFSTAAGADTQPPSAQVSADASDGCVAVEIVADEPVWATARLAGRTLPAPGLAARHELGMSWEGLAPGSAFEATIDLVDLAGLRAAVSGGTVTAAAHPGWAISEVLANPAGPEPAQEWVELVRVADGPASLAGMRVADESGQDVLPDVTVAPGARVLVVTASYDPGAPGDVAAAAGTPLARLEGTTIGQGGLANDGERVRLVDEGGVTISSFRARRDVSSAAWSGRSVERIRPAGCDLPDNVLPNAEHAATPGARNSVEPP